jgi:hypothetical protein
LIFFHLIIYLFIYLFSISFYRQKNSRNLKKQLEAAYSDLQGKFAEKEIEDRGRDRGREGGSERGREREDYSRSRSVKIQKKLKGGKNEKNESSGGNSSGRYLFENSENIRSKNSENDNIIDNDINETYGDVYDYSTIIRKKLSENNTNNNINNNTNNNRNNSNNNYNNNNNNSNSGSFNTLPYNFAQSAPYMRNSLQAGYIDEGTAQSQISELDLEIGERAVERVCVCV